MRERIGVIAWLPDPSYERIVSDLGEDTLRAAQMAGRDLTPEQVIAAALSQEMPSIPRASAETGVRAVSPGPLSVREHEIAGLITEGLSNRHIAERLLVSKRTVDAHVRHILDKLELNTRAQVSAWFTEQHRIPEIRR